ncbi:MAG: ester cyclase [Terriglobales bacterium]
MKKAVGFTILLLVIASCTATAQTKKAPNQNMVEAEFAAWNSHDADKVAACYTSDADYEDVAFGLTVHGKAELRKMATDFFTAVPDLKLEAVSTWMANGHGGAEWIFTGTDVGLFKTGKKFSVRGASLFETKGNKFSRNKDFYDSASIMRQVGVLPEAKAAETQ